MPLCFRTPWTEVNVLTYKLPTPEISSTGNGNFNVRLRGAVEAAGTPNGQSVHVRLIEDDPLDDDLLSVHMFNITHDASLWDGVLVGYDITTALVLDADGLHGTSGSDTDEGGTGYELFHRLVGPNLDSDSLDLP